MKFSAVIAPALLPLVLPALALGATPSAAASSAGATVPNNTMANIVPVSTQAAQAIVQQALGSYAASRMINRVTTPPATIPASLAGVEYTTPEQNQSPSWSGYNALNSNSSASEVQVEFNVSTATGGHVASWAGIGDNNTSGGLNLAQAGVDQEMMEAWIEFAPATKPLYVFPVSNNDEMTVLIERQGTGVWFVDIEDLSTGTYYSNDFDWGVDRSSSEWITELVGGSGVGSWSPVSFFDCYWNNSYPINSSEDSSLQWDYVYYSPSEAISAGSLSNDGTSFTTYDYAVG